MSEYKFELLVTKPNGYFYDKENKYWNTRKCHFKYNLMVNYYN